MSTGKCILPALIFLFCFGCGKKEEGIQEHNGQLKIEAVVKIDSAGPPISKYMYGMFLEHLGNVDVGDLVEDGLWAEVLDDRKFFYPVDSKEELVPVNKRDKQNQWVPLHDGSAVTMDSTKKYVGKHSPRVLLRSDASEGIMQSGLDVMQKKYTGRIILSGSPDVTVTVSLVWGNTPADRASVKFGKLTSAFTRYNFSFDCGGASPDARLEIAATGKGSFSIGAVSLMPADNVSGFRADVIGLLKELNSGLYRWGGNMSSGYDWRDGIGDPDQRPPRYEYAWDGVESNDVGTHELMKFAELINVAITLTVNTGFGDAHSAAEWVHYTNDPAGSPMGTLRARNGHPDPFDLKLWCVGNESYGFWQLGHTDLKNYIIKHNLFADRMLEADPTIKLIASGASIEEMTITGSAMHETGKVEAAFDSPGDWSGGLLKNARPRVDFISEHFYCAVDQLFDVTQGKYVDATEPLAEWTRRPANRVKSKAENYAEYHRRIPGSDKVGVYIDEWAYFTNWVHPAPTLGVAIGYARGLHEMFRHTDLIRMAGFTFGTSCISFNDTQAIYNASGLMFKLYQSQFGTIPLAITGNSPQPPQAWPAGGGMTTVNAGGDTYPLDVVAAFTDDRKFLTVAIVNPTESVQALTLVMPRLNLGGKTTITTVTGPSYLSKNLVGKSEEVTMVTTRVERKDELVIAPASINIFKFEIN